MTDTLAALTTLIAEYDARGEAQEAELNQYRDENGNVPDHKLRDYDELRMDQNEDDAYQLGLLVDRLRELTTTATA